MTAFYNEIDPRTAHWLDDLQSHGHVAPGTVATRSIEDLTGADLNGYTQVHLFAGIGGWSHALRLAGVPDGFPVWTGSCPCQPFSAAGKGRGTDDPRHLWPHMRRLIEECRPPVVFGEQVASAAGREWFAGVRSDLEALGYAVGCADLCAASVGAQIPAGSVFSFCDRCGMQIDQCECQCSEPIVAEFRQGVVAGAPHIRQRLYWVAYAVSAGWSEGWPGAGIGSVAGSGGLGGLAYASADRPEVRRPLHGELHRQGPDQECATGWLDNPDDAGSQGHAGHGNDGHEPGRHDQEQAGSVGPAIHAGWRDSLWHPCRDGRSRRIPTEPAFFPLAHELSARVVRLRGYGNAIVPALAAEFIAASLEAIAATAPTQPKEDK